MQTATIRKVCKFKDDYHAVISFYDLVHDPRQRDIFSIGVILVNYRQLVQEAELHTGTLAHVGGHCAIQDHLRSLILIPIERTFATSAVDPGGVRWVRTNPPIWPGVEVENARTAWLYQSGSVRDIFTEIVPQLYTT